jgi:hypothetical protein
VSVPTGLVCDAGRCLQVLRALAEAKTRMQDAQADQLVVVLESVRGDAELGLSDGQRAAWPGVVVRAVRRLIGEAA